jgi:hypothetical protein
MISQRTYQEVKEMFQVANSSDEHTWECKECHHTISPEETVAYHLVDKVLYGWCQPCFEQRGSKVERADLAA